MITSETHEQTFVHFRAEHKSSDYCDRCEQFVSIVSLDDSARTLGVGTRELLGLIDAGAVHVVGPSDGILVLCGHSLAVRIAFSDATVRRSAEEV